MSQNPTLVILSGGASSRLWPLRDKSLMVFGAEPLLATQLHTYRKLGFENVVIVANPDNRADIETITAPFGGVDVVVQESPIGMGDAILKAEPKVDPDAAMYVTQVHDVVDIKMHTDILENYRANRQASYIAGIEMEAYFPGGYLVIDDDGRITGIVEKPGPENRPSNLVNIVAHVHERAGQFMDAIRAEYAKDIPSDDHYERAMAALMEENVYKIVPYRGEWNALKYPWHVLDIMNFFLNQIDGQQIAESAKIADTASISGNVFIGENVRIFAGAAVVGPAYIGDNTIVGNNSLVRNSMVLNNCEVGFTTEIARSYVAAHCGMHACRVLDSVFAPHVNFSAGCTTANLRIDKGNVYSTVKGKRMDTGRDKLGAIIGEGAFISVDAMTMPGIKVGSEAQVGPTTNVVRDVKDRTRIYVKQELMVIDESENLQEV